MQGIHQRVKQGEQINLISSCIPFFTWGLTLCLLERSNEYIPVQKFQGFKYSIQYINGLVQDCSNSSALAMELLQSCTKPSIWYW